MCFNPSSLTLVSLQVEVRQFIETAEMGQAGIADLRLLEVQPDHVLHRGDLEQTIIGKLLTGALESNFLGSGIRGQRVDDDAQLLKLGNRLLFLELRHGSKRYKAVKRRTDTKQATKHRKKRDARMVRVQFKTWNTSTKRQRVFPIFSSKRPTHLLAARAAFEIRAR